MQQYLIGVQSFKTKFNHQKIFWELKVVFITTSASNINARFFAQCFRNTFVQMFNVKNANTIIFWMFPWTWTYPGCDHGREFRFRYVPCPDVSCQ